MTPVAVLAPQTQFAKIPLISYILLHVACLAVFWTGISWRGVAILAGTYFFRVFWMGAGLHRLFAHRAFKTSRPMQSVFAVLAMTGLQRGPLWWAATHRFHHQHADLEDDLHSPRFQGFGYAHWGWFFDAKNRPTDLSKVPDLARYPELVFLDGALACTLVAAAYAGLLFWLFGWEGILWGFCVSTVFVWHTVHWIQSFSHSCGGYRRFRTRDDSRNHWLVGVLSGEFHNNHHAFPSAARQGYTWWEFDGVYQLLQVMSWFGLVWDLKLIPEHAHEREYA